MRQLTNWRLWWAKKSYIQLSQPNSNSGLFETSQSRTIKSNIQIPAKWEGIQSRFVFSGKNLIFLMKQHDITSKRVEWSQIFVLGRQTYSSNCLWIRILYKCLLTNIRVWADQNEHFRLDVFWSVWCPSGFIRQDFLHRQYGAGYCENGWWAALNEDF